jgi:uroporphyrin-III C-methyltransferase/precorrin-2 dehydrogenase/sirohydrochlorin ferrochelatase
VALIGSVTLVGAGPGDPELLTRRAVARLRTADLVLYDALVDDRILRYARRAQRFFVGKRAGRHAVSQETIHAVMIRAARRGRHVVRLKGGDPFVFGRGGEEAVALRRAGIRCEVVPGISSAIAAPESAGIPVTHRGMAAGVLVVTGHDERTFAEAIRGLAGRRLTLVVMMGLARAAAIASTLLDDGWRSRTPVAIVAGATSAGQREWYGTLAELAADAHRAIAFGAAATIVVGDVVTLAETDRITERPERQRSPEPRAPAAAACGV